MKKILILLIILCPLALSAQQFQENIYVNGNPMPAEFVVKSGSERTCMLGSGHNACISQYIGGSVVIPATVNYNGQTFKVEEINSLAFRLCSKITSVHIPEGVKRVGNFAFVGCTALEEVDLPSTLTSLGSGAFIGLYEQSLKKVKCDALVPPTFEYNDVFHFHSDGIGTADNTARYIVNLYVPQAAKTAYEQSQFSNPAIGWNAPEGWANFSAITDGYGATFRIKNKEDLRALRNAVNGGQKFVKVVLESDLDFDGEVWTAPIGDTEEHAFRSNPGDSNSALFDGQGHSISGLTVTHDYAGLFGHIYDAEIKNLTIKNCQFNGTVAAGAVCASTHGIGSQTISSVYTDQNIVKGGKYCGGLVGLGSTVVISNCVCEDGQVTYISSASTDDEERWLGGMLGWCYNSGVYNSAVFDEEIKADRSSFVNNRTGDIVAATADNMPSYVNNCFSTLQIGTSANVRHSKSVYKGMEYTYKNENRETVTTHFTGSKDETMLCIGVMGLDSWVYCPGEYPMPAALENRLPAPKPNIMTLRPKTMTTERVNGLQLPEDESSFGYDFSDFSGVGSSFLTLPFKASSLWIDDNFTGKFTQGMLPIGKTKITATNGVRYDRKLEATENGELIIQVPVFKTDDENKLVLDEDGQPIIESYEEVHSEESDYNPNFHTVYLPYATTLPVNCVVFKPVNLVSDEEGFATIELEFVLDRKIEPFTPYYVAVETGEVSLGTSAQVTIPTTKHTISLGNDYEFAGSVAAMSAAEAASANVYKMGEIPILWTIPYPSEDVPAFRAFFRATADKQSAIMLSLQHFYDENFEYELEFDDNDNYVLVVSEYKGDGGHVTVPSTLTVTLKGEERELPIVDINGNVFAEKGNDILSIDLSQCEHLLGVWVDRDMESTSFYGLNSSALIFLPEGKGNKAPNVVLGGECQRLVLKEGTAFQSPRIFTAVNVDYERSMAANDSYTICLPYKAPAQQGVKYYELSAVENKYMKFSEVEQTEPGVPYLVVTSSGTDNFNYDGSDGTTKTPTDVVNTPGSTYASGYAMHGTFDKITPANTVGKYILQDGNKWQRAKTENPNVYLSAFRAYITASANAPALLETLFDGTTAIEGIQAVDNDGSVQWFDLQGRRISEPRKGAVSIMKGKKIIK